MNSETLKKHHKFNKSDILSSESLHNRDKTHSCPDLSYWEFYFCLQQDQQTLDQQHVLEHARCTLPRCCILCSLLQTLLSPALWQATNNKFIQFILNKYWESQSIQGLLNCKDVCAIAIDGTALSYPKEEVSASRAVSQSRLCGALI